MKLSKFKMLFLLVCITSTVAHAQIKMGAAGDSLTDEYLNAPTAAKTDLAAYSWTEMLGLLRSNEVSFGSYTTKLLRSKSRHRGFEHNWAKVAASASDAARINAAGMVMKIDNIFVGSRYLTDQVGDLVNDVSNGKVEYAFVGAGSNDFFYYTYDFDINGNAIRNSNDPSEFAFYSDVANSLLYQVDRLLAVNAWVVLALIPIGTAGGAADQQTIDGINAANAILLAGAEERSIAVVDLFGFDMNTDKGVTVGGVTVLGGTTAIESDLVWSMSPNHGKCNSSYKCAGSDHKYRFAAEDGLHPNTIIQGLIANQVVEALNNIYNTGIKPLTEAEIVDMSQ